MKNIEDMTECEKLDAGLPYSFWDEEVNLRKENAMKKTQELHAIDPQDSPAIENCLRALF